MPLDDNTDSTILQPLSSASSLPKLLLFELFWQLQSTQICAQQHTSLVI